MNSMTPSFPKELSPRYPHPPLWGMELLKERCPAKTVSLIETVLIKNRVVGYCTNHIYTLLFDGHERKRENKRGIRVSFQVPSATKGGAVSHVG